jgi:hypothetical protein
MKISHLGPFKKILCFFSVAGDEPGRKKRRNRLGTDQGGIHPGPPPGQGGCQAHPSGGVRVKRGVRLSKGKTSVNCIYLY